MRIALLGTRGIPANYGGFETFAEELSARLVQRGHQVTVYCRAHHAKAGLSEFRGAQLVVLPTIRTKHLDTPVHSALSCLHLLTRGAEAAIFCNGANAVFTYWPRLLGIPTVLNVDGLERKRKKWGRTARAWYRFSERLATLCPDARHSRTHSRIRSAVCNTTGSGTLRALYEQRRPNCIRRSSAPRRGIRAP